MSIYRAELLFDLPITWVLVSKERQIKDTWRLTIDGG